MSWLPDEILQYFESLTGLTGVLPIHRVLNKPLLTDVFTALMQEPCLTLCDLGHLRTLMKMADSTVIPSLKNGKNLAAAQSYLFETFPNLLPGKIEFCLDYLAILLSRHGHGDECPKELKEQYRIYKLAQSFNQLSFGLVEDYVLWLHQNGFSAVSTYFCLFELKRFTAWRIRQKLSSLNAIGDNELAQYLREQVTLGKASSRQRSLSSIKPFFYFIQERVDGNQTIPKITVYSSLSDIGAEMAASSEEIRLLNELLQSGLETGQDALMLALILSYGCTVKMLTGLKFLQSPFEMTYTVPAAVRTGYDSHNFDLNHAPGWLQNIVRHHMLTAGHYVFWSPYSLKREIPVSPDTCQRSVQALVKRLIGYPITVNQIGRGAIRNLARQVGITDFMSLTDSLNKSRVTRMYVWLGVHTLMS